MTKNLYIGQQVTLKPEYGLHIVGTIIEIRPPVMLALTDCAISLEMYKVAWSNGDFSQWLSENDFELLAPSCPICRREAHKSHANHCNAIAEEPCDKCDSGSVYSVKNKQNDSNVTFVCDNCLDTLTLTVCTFCKDQVCTCIPF